MNSTPKGKSIFRKRAHRPWKPSLLETTLQNTHQNPAEVLGSEQHKSFEMPAMQNPSHLQEFSNPNTAVGTHVIQESSPAFSRPVEFFEQRLEMALEAKTREIQELNQKLSSKEDNRLTLGGFLKPKNIILPNEEEAVQKTSLLRNELREKELEVQQITNNLRITQLLEQLQQSEAARLSETTAREAAEEKAVFAQSKVNQAVDYRRLAEERAEMAEKTYFKLEQTVSELESKHEAAEQQYLKLLEDKEHQYNTSLLERDKYIRATIEEKEKQLKAILEIKELEEKRRQSAEERLDHDHAHYETSHAQIERQVVELSEKIHGLEMQLCAEKGNSEAYAAEFASLQEKLQTFSAEKASLFEQNAKNSEYIKKMAVVLSTERNLRKILEEKIKMASHHIYTLEMQIQSEEQARRAAEEKAKQTMEQASKAVMQLLNAGRP